MKKEFQEALERKRAADAEIKSHRKSAIDEIKELIELFGIKAKELGFSSDSLDSEPDTETSVPSKIPAKYRDPVTQAEWSGRGRKPRWFVEDADTYLIK